MLDEVGPGLEARHVHLVHEHKASFSKPTGVCEKMTLLSMRRQGGSLSFQNLGRNRVIKYNASWEVKDFDVDARRLTSKIIEANGVYTGYNWVIWGIHVTGL